MNWSLPISIIATAMIWRLATRLILLSAAGMAAADTAKTAAAAGAAGFNLLAFRNVTSIERLAGFPVAHDLRRDGGSHITPHTDAKAGAMHLASTPYTDLEYNMAASLDLIAAKWYRNIRHLQATRRSFVHGQRKHVPRLGQWTIAAACFRAPWRRAAG
jgi:hypothetical protein